MALSSSIAKSQSRTATRQSRHSRTTKQSESQLLTRKLWLMASTSSLPQRRLFGMDQQIKLSCGCKGISEHIALGRAFPSRSCRSALKYLSEKFLRESQET